MSEKVGKEIGNFIGKFVEADANNFSGIWHNYMRIRVAIDVRSPLKRRMKIKKQGSDWTWINFKYERLPTFYFFCGIIGHNDRFCEKFFYCKERPTELPYGAWLRGSNRKDSVNIGERWLRSTALSMVGANKSPVSSDHMNTKKDIPYFEARRKGYAEVNLKNDVNRGIINCDKSDGRELRISCNSNPILERGSIGVNLKESLFWTQNDVVGLRTMQ